MSQQVIWIQQRMPDLHDAEYYELGPVCRVVGARAASVECEGETRWEHEDGTVLRTAADFRAAFPEGVIPMDGEHGWAVVNNGWFSVYVEGEEEPGEPLYSLGDALAEAEQLAGHAVTQVPVPDRRGNLASALKGARRGG